MGADRDPGRLETAVGRRQDAHHVRALGALPFEFHGESAVPGERESAVGAVPRVELTLGLPQISAAPGEEPFRGSAVHRGRGDPLPSRRRDVESVGSELPGVRRVRAGHYDEPGRPRLAGGDRLRPETRGALERPARLALGEIREITEHDDDLPADVVAGVAVPRGLRGVRKPDAVSAEVELALDLPGLRKGERANLVAAEPLVAPGAQARPAIRDAGDESEGDPELIVPGKRLGAGGRELRNQIAPRLRRPRRPDGPAIGPGRREREHIGAHFVGRLRRRGGREENRKRDRGCSRPDGGGDPADSAERGHLRTSRERGPLALGGGGEWSVVTVAGMREGLRARPRGSSRRGRSARPHHRAGRRSRRGPGRPASGPGGRRSRPRP